LNFESRAMGGARRAKFRPTSRCVKGVQHDWRAFEDADGNPLPSPRLVKELGTILDADEDTLRQLLQSRTKEQQRTLKRAVACFSGKEESRSARPARAADYFGASRWSTSSSEVGSHQRPPGPRSTRRSASVTGVSGLRPSSAGRLREMAEQGAEEASDLVSCARTLKWLQAQQKGPRSEYHQSAETTTDPHDRARARPAPAVPLERSRAGMRPRSAPSSRPASDAGSVQIDFKRVVTPMPHGLSGATSTELQLLYGGGKDRRGRPATAMSTNWGTSSYSDMVRRDGRGQAAGRVSASQVRDVVRGPTATGTAITPEVHAPRFRRG